MIIGLTGGSGTGKTTVSRYFASHGFEVIDYDKITREIYLPGSACLNEIRAIFGDGVFETDGALKRKALGDIVFADKNALQKLNNTVYKYILSYTSHKIETSEGKKLMLDAPTLFEAGLDKKCDKIIAVIADREIRIQRITDRDSISRDAAQNRIDSQKTDDFYKENCDYIIDNSSDIENLEMNAAIILRSINNEI